MAEPSILHIDTGSAFRGGQRQLLLLVEQLRDGGIRQAVACPKASELSKRITGVPVIALSPYSLIRKLNYRRLAGAIADHEVNIVHAHDGEAHTLGLLVKLARREIRLVVTRRVVFSVSSLLSARFKYRRLVDQYIAISEAVAATLRGIGIPAARIELIPSSFDLAAIRLAPAGCPLIDDIIRKHRYLIVTAGALTREKDFATAIEAFELVSGRVPGTALLILGEGPQGGRLVEMIVGRQISNVYLLGQQEPLAPILKACHLFLLTSISEGLGSAAIEAAACGLPLVVSKVGGLPEIAEHNFNGITCYPGQPQSFADAMIDLLSHEEKRRTMAAHSREKAAEFDLRKTVPKTVNLYKRVLGE